MKILTLLFSLFLALFATSGAMSSTKNGDKIMLSPNPSFKTIYLAGGCFWGTQAYFDKVVGVAQTRVGYANGDGDDTRYEILSISGHAESVEVKFDENIVSLNEILEHFWRTIDPYSLNKQGNDVGTQYRSGVYFTSLDDEKTVRNFITHKQSSSDKKIAVEVAELRNFVLAETYHQKYLQKNPGGYCHVDLSLVSKPLYDESVYVVPSDEKKREMLSAEQYAITQNKATERPFSSQLDSEKRAGIYVDVVSKKPLFASSDKFDAGCGWPSFTKPITTDALDYAFDGSHGMERTEVMSARGGAHLGHVFDDGPADKGGLRYCINGASLEFIPLENMDERGYSQYKKYVE